MGPVLDGATALVALAAVGAGSALGQRWLAGLLGGAEATVGRLRLLARAGLLGTYVVGLVALAATGGLAALDALLVAVGLDAAPAGIGDLVALVVGLGLPVLPAVGGYLGVFPAAREARRQAIDRRTAALRLARYLLGLVTTVVVGVWATLRIVGGGPLETVLGLVGAVAVVTVLSPLLVRLVASTRGPEPVEREVIERACERAGATPDHLRVQSVGDAGRWAVYTRGPPGYRHLFVTDAVLVPALEGDSTTLDGLVAVAAARQRLRYRPLKVAVVLAALLVGWAAVSGYLGPVSGYAGVALSLVLGLGGLAAVRQVARRADRLAADRVGAATVRDALDARAEANDEGRSVGALGRLVGSEPGLASRITSLDRQTAD